MSGKTLGIVGLGAIGKVVANCAKGFGMKILAYAPYINAPYCREHQIASVSFEKLIRTADVITLHLPLNENTRHMIHTEVIASMKNNALIVNASRDGIIDEAAAYQALKCGKLEGLGLDTFEVELPAASPLFELPNVVVTPHTGAHTKEATENMTNAAVQNLIDVLTGRACPYIISK